MKLNDAVNLDISQYRHRPGSGPPGEPRDGHQNEGVLNRNPTQESVALSQLLTISHICQNSPPEHTDMSALLSSHLEQISLCATSIADLPFPKPKIFTNALLSSHDITSLIRDTEQHERALFHLAPPPLPKVGSSDFANTGASATSQHRDRRANTYAGRQPKSKVVAAVLGGDLYSQTRSTNTAGRQKGDLDVELLLHGAEKLSNV